MQSCAELRCAHVHTQYFIVCLVIIIEGKTTWLMTFMWLYILHPSILYPFLTLHLNPSSWTKRSLRGRRGAQKRVRDGVRFRRTGS